ncbi:hypothetical protein [Chryseobacterium sp. A321]
MKTIASLFFMILLCSAQGLQAQMYLFNAFRFAGAPDSAGKHTFELGNFKVLLNSDKNEVFHINGDNDAVLKEDVLAKGVEVKKNPNSTQYIFKYANGSLSSIVVTDYEGAGSEDDLKVYDGLDEKLHLKGIFQAIYVRKE